MNLKWEFDKNPNSMSAFLLKSDGQIILQVYGSAESFSTNYSPAFSFMANFSVPYLKTENLTHEKFPDLENNELARKRLELACEEIEKFVLKEFERISKLIS